MESYPNVRQYQDSSNPGDSSFISGDNSLQRDAEDEDDEMNSSVIMRSYQNSENGTPDPVDVDMGGEYEGGIENALVKGLAEKGMDGMISDEENKLD